MNALGWRGPEFQAFCGALSALVTEGLWFLHRNLEPDEASGLPFRIF
jgi:hypothetical protein